jgi:hypothetical protein
MKNKQRVIIDHFADRLRYIATVPNRLYNWKEEEIKVYREMNKIQLTQAFKFGLKCERNKNLSDDELTEKWFKENFEYE